MANRGHTTSNWFVIFGVVLVSGTLAGAQRMGAQASPSVAVSGVICVDEGHDGRCDADDGTVALEDVELIGPDGSTLARDVTGEEGPGYEFSGLPVLPVGERYRVKHDRSGSPAGGLELATAGGVQVADPSTGSGPLDRDRRGSRAAE